MAKNGQKWPQCKGYSLCQILSLGQKIKLRKTCKKRFQNKNTLELFNGEKRFQQTANIPKRRAFQKWAKLTTMQRLEPMQLLNTQFGSKNKIA